MHTPDSSRYWIAHSYEERFQNGLEPENVDKVRCLVFYIYLHVYMDNTDNILSTAISLVIYLDCDLWCV